MSTVDRTLRHHIDNCEPMAFDFAPMEVRCQTCPLRYRLVGEFDRDPLAAGARIYRWRIVR